MTASNIPFIATVSLLLLWGTGAKNDSEVVFFGATVVSAYILAQALAAASFQPEIESLDIIQVVAVEQSVVMCMIAAGFAFCIGLVGTPVFKYSPFIGLCLYSSLVSLLFRDISVTGDIRATVWAFVIASGMLSEHAFRLNLAAIIFGFICLDNGLGFVNSPNVGTFETVSLLAGLCILMIHDLVVRFFLEPIKVLVEAGFLAMTAFVMVDSSLQLGMLQTSPDVARNNTLLAVDWSDSLLFVSPPLTSSNTEVFSNQLLHAAPILTSLFCASYLLRTIRSQYNSLTWYRWQQLAGVAVGTLIGLHLWAGYSQLSSFDPTSPLAISWVFAALLISSCGILGLESKYYLSSKLWHMKYYTEYLKPKKSSPVTQLSDATRKNTPYPVVLLTSYSSSYPEVFEVAIQMKDTQVSLESAQNRSKSNNSMTPFDATKQSFIWTSHLYSLSKLTEEVCEKLSERSALLEKEVEVFSEMQGPEATSISARLKQRNGQLLSDLQEAKAFVETLQKDLAQRDQDTVTLIENTLKSQSLKKSETDDLDSMHEAIRRRMKRRQKVETPSPVSKEHITVTNNKDADVSLPVVDVSVISNSERVSSNSPFKSPSRRGLFGMFSKKKNTSPSQDLNVSQVTGDGDSDIAPRSGSKRWSKSLSFRSRKATSNAEAS